MIVSVQRDMPDLKSKLERSGYKVVFSDECRHPVDAVIYRARNEMTPYFCRHPDSIYDLNCSSFANESAPYGSRQGGGVIEINVTGRSIDEIEGLLMRGRQNTLF